MAHDDNAPNLAIFCDYENVAIGAREARFDAFDIGLVLERLLDKGKVVVKKAYADWDRYKSARRPLHEAAFELIEIPHVSLSGKNSADIRLVVDALDLSYTKSHVDAFVIISGDSDFSPLVSKLRENDKVVIAVGVKNSTSDLLVENCDEFIYYDDLVRARGGKQIRKKKKAESRSGKDADKKKTGDKKGPEKKAADKKTDEKKAAATEEATPGVEDDGKTEAERKLDALEMVMDQVEALFRDRDDNLWGSMVKQTLKRKRPSFNESFHGYRSFNELLEDARDRGLLELQKDERSGGYLVLGFGPNA